MMRKVNGWRNYRTYSGSIGPPRRSTGETPFSLTYGAEVVIPFETGFPTTRTSSFNSKDNDEKLARNLDLIEEKRADAMVQLAYYQQN